MKSNAPDILKKGLAAMEERAKLRDKPDGERSMAKTVQMFNTYTGKSITESEGWAFMVFLKMVRAQGGTFHEDDYVDGASFMALLGECESTVNVPGNEKMDLSEAIDKALKGLADKNPKWAPPSNAMPHNFGPVPTVLPKHDILYRGCYRDTYKYPKYQD